jgi:hypothetical protein
VDLANQSPDKVAELSAIWERMTQSFIELAKPTAQPDSPKRKSGKQP